MLKYKIESVGSLVNQAVTVLPGEVVVGTIVDVSSKGIPQVDFPGKPGSRFLEAITIVPVNKDSIGRQAALLFQNGNLEKPMIMGLVCDFYQASTKAPPVTDPSVVNRNKYDPVDVELDGERVSFTAKKEIVLKCGKASITLTRSGKILIRGTYVLNRSSGTNRIKGGSVQIN